MNTHLPTVICLMGPTASGKTAAALELVQLLPCDIISVDSAMVYRGMDIGTAKPTAAEQAVAPHRLIDIRDPAENYSAADFCSDAVREIDQILAADRIPLLVGGTMLYFSALQKGLSTLPPADPAVRDMLEQQAQELGWQAMHEKLQAVDPEAAARIHPNDPQRIQRALEVYEISGQSLTSLQQHKPEPLNYHFANYALIPEERKILHQRIEQRFDQMLAQGFIEEVEKLYNRGDLHLNLPSMRAVGYRQVWDYIAGSSTKAQMRELGIIATRQLAKRQLTWLRSWQSLNAIAADVNTIVKQIITTASGRI